MTEKRRFIIIGRSNCPFCIHAADLCVAKKEEHIFLDFASRPEILEDYKDYYSQKTVPIILANSLVSGLVQKIGGYTDLLDFLK